MNHKNNKIYKIGEWLFVLLFSSFLFFCANKSFAAAATLNFFPSSGNFNVGENFSVKVLVNSGGENINATEGNILFNQNEVQVTSISKNNSIFTLWTTEPTFSNSTGNIFFGGGTPTNFNGQEGTIITINLKAKAIATTQLKFVSGSILAADGLGTNVLSEMNGSSYVFKPLINTPKQEEVPPETEYLPPGNPGQVPLSPVINSLTHPDPNKWYANNNPEFTWSLSSDVTEIKLSIDKKPATNPSVSYAAPIFNKKIENLDNGAWYLHIKFKNKIGWGGITHRKVLIDNEPPKPFNIIIDKEGDTTNPVPILQFGTSDSVSGIDYYSIKIGNDDAIKFYGKENIQNYFRVPPQLPGERMTRVEAIDLAGNKSYADINLQIDPLETPQVTDYSPRIETGEALIVKGTSKYPDSTLVVYIKKEGEDAVQQNVKTDENGSWTFVYNRSTVSGVYQAWAEITDSRGAKSNPTEKITIASSLPILFKIGKAAIDYLTIIATLVLLILGLIVIILYFFRKIYMFKQKIRKETEDVKNNVTRAFNALRAEVKEQIEFFDQKPGMTKKEKEVRDKLNEALNISEKYINKEIKDIDKNLK